MKVTSNAFLDGDWIPKRYTARGEDISPDFKIEDIHEGACTLAITMDDSSHPIFPNYNHWLIWNIPVNTYIPEGIKEGAIVDSLGGAMQGIGYGRNRYKGPKPPLKSIHEYTFTVYSLNCRLSINEKSRKEDFLKAIDGHVLEKVTLKGKFQSRRKE